ncbi:MAG: hypothetical protein H7Y86_13855, partial [Rhizobacter sp.]|nr:hypothetical protein [Ferruginibacter sp.]MBC7936430.1 hypothetical protein [Ferruginibacter sp.]
MKRISNLSFVMYAAFLFIISISILTFLFPSCTKLDVHVQDRAEIQN